MYIVETLKLLLQDKLMFLYYLKYSRNRSQYRKQSFVDVSRCWLNYRQLTLIDMKERKCFGRFNLKENEISFLLNVFYCSFGDGCLHGMRIINKVSRISLINLSFLNEVWARRSFWQIGHQCHWTFSHVLQICKSRISKLKVRFGSRNFVGQ